MKNPTMLYKCPGPHDIHGGKFDTLIVDAGAEGAIDKALKSGWALTTPEAKALSEKQIAGPTPGDEVAPTRSELEEQAASMGIKFDGRTSDSKLMKMIDEALEQ